MAAVPTVSNSRLKPKKPLDVWSVREKLCLASAVFKIGDQNWVSVSRAIKPYAEPSRPPEWFHQKNCLLQYYDLMEQLEQPKRKRGGEKSASESDTPSLQIMRKMTIERSEQLKKEILEMQQKFKQMKSEVESIKAGIWDDQIEHVWQEIQEEQRNAEAQEKIEVKVEDDYDESKIAVVELLDSSTPVGDVDESTQDSVGDISVLTDEESTHSASSVLHTPPSTAVASTADKLSSVSSHLLKLLKSDVKTATELQRLKHEQEQGQQQEQLQQQCEYFQSNQQTVLSQSQIPLLKVPVTQDETLIPPPPSNTAPTLSRLLSTAKGQVDVVNTIQFTPSLSEVSLHTSTKALLMHESAIKDTAEEIVIKDIEESNLTACISLPQNSCTQSDPLECDILTPAVSIQEIAEITKSFRENVDAEKNEEQQADLKMTSNCHEGETRDDIKEELDKESQDEDEDISVKRSIESLASEAELTESSIKDEPLSPTSSISSKISEAGSKRGIEVRGQSCSQSSGLSTRKAYHTDTDKKDEDGSFQHSDMELSEDEIREREDILAGQMASVNSGSILSESYPNSPASLSICSDTEEEKSFKQWKKSIMLVWRAAATHKYANVFLHPVTNDIAPGYHSVVLRPMDLSTIKKNVETGVIRSTIDFQHDMMLMFTNAIMYNSSNHNVFRMAKEMYDDVMQHIEYVNTQMIIQTSDAKNLRQSRRTDASDKEDDAKKRKIHTDQSETEGKTKKRKARVEENVL
ncbi:hypothetical protein BsWGS_02062 [Bradybaena similaris]